MKRLLPILIFTLFFSIVKSQTSTTGPTITPDPFIDRTLMTYSVSLADTVSCSIISQIGQLVLTVFSNSFIPAGLHQDSIIMTNNPPGIYYLRLTFKSSAQVVKLIKTGSVGIKEFDSQFQVKLFPNPAQNSLTIEFLNYQFKEEGVEFKIIGALGKTIKRENLKLKKQNLELDVSDLKSGVYSIQIESDHLGTVSKKFVISR